MSVIYLEVNKEKKVATLFVSQSLKITNFYTVRVIRGKSGMAGVAQAIRES